MPIKPAKKYDSTTMSVSLDEKDLAILRLLQENARATVKELQQKFT